MSSASTHPTSSSSASATLPATMKATLFYEPRVLRYEETPTPQHGPGELLVRVGSALTCGTDLKCYRRGHPVLLKSTPSPFGHEFAGTVAALGEGVTAFKLGQRVVCANSAPCMDCFYCEKGQHNLCEHLEFLNGAYAEYIRVPAPIVAHNTYELPEDVPFEVAAFTEPLAVSLRGVMELNVKPGETVAVIGLGPIGLLLARVAKECGAHVSVFARNAMKLELGASFAGADAVASIAEGLDPEAIKARFTPEGRGFDVVLEAVGLPEIWQQAVQLARRGGRVNLFAGCKGGSTVTFETGRLHYDEIAVHSLFHHTPAYVRLAYDWLTTGRLDPRPLITKHLPLAELEQAFTAMEQGQAVKLAISN